MINRILIPPHPKPHHKRHRLICQIAMMPERLSRMRIRDMDLDERDTDPEKRIAEGNAGVRLAFVVGLEGVQGDVEAGCLVFCGGFDVGEGGGAVDVWLAGAEEVEVGAVEEEDGHSVDIVMI
ncbi:hypothetical protein MW887_006498 [Aspergillus wentii]|nr:hypothetical protein MW887_006498 [Aspergillus wentii]